MGEIDWGRYVLRRVGGSSFLLDTEQSGKPYMKPVVLNDSAADIVERLMSGLSAEAVAEEISSHEEGLSRDAILSDIKIMCDDIREQMNIE